MSTIRFGALIGLALGAIWVFAGLGSAILAGVLTGVGALGGVLVAMVARGRLDLTEYIGHRHER